MITLKQAEEIRSYNASVTAFLRIGESFGHSTDVVYQVTSDFLDDIGYRNLELAETKDFIDFWKGFTQAEKDYINGQRDDNPAKEFDLSDFNNAKLIAFK